MEEVHSSKHGVAMKTGKEYAGSVVIVLLAPHACDTAAVSEGSTVSDPVKLQTRSLKM
jgi:hypothetical protein